MLQCTALTDVPEVEALVALITEEDASHGSPDALALDDFLLCELAEHDERTEHAAHFWTPEPASGRELWMLWTGSGADRVRRFVETAPCPAILHHLITGEVEACALYEEHPATHSWDVRDPLGDLVAERAQKGAPRILGREDPDS
ncbi:hypothetical protein [Streptomyces sp. NBC_00102]|uniref:hypothetical protein n=1 Tax=Streptomyces sp. NBC_00102 TaxID=2975652 RepID=UPI0022561E6A|nr:hypothetical protein [Streptomyces sp. NBC_00102]MCX5397803.1 hypothetical protein [Streptomyces sp. NBC_00102]